MKIWKYGNMETLICGNIKYGNREIWKQGNVEIRKFGNIEVWEYGNMEI